MRLDLYRLWWREGGVTRHQTGTIRDWTPHPPEGGQPQSPEWGVEEKSFTVKTLPKDNVTVWVDEEYGHRRWLWKTPFSEKDLEGFWKNLETIPAAKDLPGTVERVFPFPQEGTEPPLYVWGEDQSFLYCMRDPLWTCHLHLDDDSHLAPPGSPQEVRLRCGGEPYFLHAGHVVEDLDALRKVAEGVV